MRTVDVHSRLTTARPKTCGLAFTDQGS